MSGRFFGWAFLAADFFQHDPSSPGGETDFFGNALAQIPNFGPVISHAFANRLWLIILIVVLEFVALGFGLLTKKVERELSRK